MNLVDELAGLAARATPIPWQCYSEPEVGMPPSLFAGVPLQSGFGPIEPLSPQDINLIVALRNNLPTILAALQAGEREAAHEYGVLADIAEMMGEFVDNWPQPKRVDTALKLIAKTMRAALDPPKHVYWGAGEPDCPADIKASNGELHTLRCKVCGNEDAHNTRCLALAKKEPQP